MKINRKIKQKKETRFRVKKYGWGWYPCTWQGWLVVLIWEVLFIFSLLMIEKNNREIGKNITVIVINTFILIYAGYKKDGKPKWREREIGYNGR